MRCRHGADSTCSGMSSTRMMTTTRDIGDILGQCRPLLRRDLRGSVPIWRRVANASRTISLSPRVRYVHVHSGETVAFRIGDKMLGWTFMVEPVGGGRSIDLSAIFPDLPQAKGVVVFIERSNLYRAG